MNADVTVSEEGRREAGAEMSFPMRKFNRLREKVSNNKPFSIFVIFPTLLTALYLFVIASPQYISEAHFVVRGHSSQSGLSLSSLIQSSGGSSGPTSENTYVVQDYMQSRDAAQLLIKQNNLYDVFARPEADFIGRFPFLLWPRDFEHFYKYYQRHVLAEQDSETNISILTVRTFRAADSQRIARALLDAGENLVNEINRRQRENLIRVTRQEMEESQEKLRKINVQLGEYRNSISLLDPMRQSAPLLSSISSLRNMLTSTNMQLSQLQQSAPGSPLIAAYQRQAAILSEQIKQASKQITGSDESLVPKITGYEDLIVQRDIQQRVLLSNVASLEAAKEQANQQMIYVDEVTEPNVPDWPEYPRNILVLVIVFFSSLGLYLMGSLLIAGAREHSLQ